MPRYSLDVAANVAKYQAEFAKVPGMTEKAAAKAAMALERRMNKAQERAAREAQRQAKRSGDAWTSAFKIATAQMAFAFVQRGVSSFMQLTQGVIDYRNELTDAAARTGLATSTLQALRLSAESTGQEFGQLLKATERIPKLLADVEAGSKRQIDAFQKLGVATHDETGAMRSADDVTRDLIAALGDIQDPTLKAARGMDLFGRSGGKVVQALGAGNALFEQHVKLAEKYGVDVGPDAADSAARMQEEMARMGLVARGAGDDLWEAFGGDDGGLGALKAMSSSLIFATELIVRMRKGIEGKTNLQTIENLLAPWRSGARMEAFTGALTGAKDAVQEYLEEADKTDRIAGAASSAVEALNANLERNADASREAARLEAELNSIQFKTLAEVAEMEAKQLEERLRALREFDEAYEASIQRQRALDQQAADARIGLAQTSFGAISDVATMYAEKNEKDKRRAYAVAKAAAVAEAILNTAAGVSRAFKDYPFPASVAAAAAAGIAGGIATAKVASAPAPSFYAGTARAQSTGMDPSAFLSLLHQDEAVLNKTGAELIGRETIERANAGIGGGGRESMYALLNVDGRRLAYANLRQVRAGSGLQAEFVRLAGTSSHVGGYI